jgi:hypothetical protein
MPETAPPPPKSDAELLERLQDLVRRAEQGDESAMPELRAALDTNPWIWERYGDLAQQSQAAWLQLIAGQNLLLRESIERKAEQMRAELAGPDPSPQERLLVACVVACWLQTQYADAAYAQLQGNNPGQHTLALRRQSSAQQRYLHAIRALATVQKLLRPAPSPLQLLRRPVDETAGPPAALRARAGATPDGVPVVN